jgi:hypothetical protein
MQYKNLQVFITFDQIEKVLTFVRRPPAPSKKPAAPPPPFAAPLRPYQQLTKDNDARTKEK